MGKRFARELRYIETVRDLNKSLSAKYVPAKRPQVLEGRAYKYTTGCGSLYITVNRDLAGSPHELFTAHSKNGGCVSALLNTLSRVTSIALRAGVDASSIVKTMKGQDCGYCREVDEISSCADAVGKATAGGYAQTWRPILPVK